MSLLDEFLNDIEHSSSSSSSSSSDKQRRCSPEEGRGAAPPRSESSFARTRLHGSATYEKLKPLHLELEEVHAFLPYGLCVDNVVTYAASDNFIVFSMQNGDLIVYALHAQAPPATPPHAPQIISLSERAQAYTVAFSPTNPNIFVTLRKNQTSRLWKWR